MGKWFNDWEHRLQLNVSKIIWSAKDHAALLADKKRKNGLHASPASSSQGSAKYPANYAENSIMEPEVKDKVSPENIDSSLAKHEEVENMVDSTKYIGTEESTIRNTGLHLYEVPSPQNSDFYMKELTISSRIPISVCALPCKVGEKKVMSTVSSI